MRGRDQLAWLTLAGVLVLIAWLSLDRVQHERLVLFPLPFDRAPYAVEVSDAWATARTWTIPALAFLAVAIVAVAVSQRVGPIESVRRHWTRVCALVERHPRLCVLFGVASAADFVSTLMYFHSHRIDDELHPGIKLITYAYGLTIGCLIGKAIQACLALMIAAAFPKFARPILFVLVVAYSAAAAWNLLLP